MRLSIGMPGNGHPGFSSSKRTMQMHKNSGFTLIELLIVVSIIGILGSIAIPGLVRARESGNEASAIGSLRAISSGQTAFAASCGGGGFAQDLSALSTAPSGGVPFISPDLAGGIKSGYDIANTGEGAPIQLAVDTCNGVADSMSAFLATATPSSLTTGQRSFGIDQRQTIYQDNTGGLLSSPLVASGSVSPLQ